MQRFLFALLRNAFAIGLCCLLALPAAAGQTRTLLVLGDSISAAYGMSLDQGWVALLEARLRDSHPHYQVVNASISGETTGGGLRRLPALLQRHQPSIVLLELGGNDGLRGYPPASIRDNLTGMTRMAQASGATVLLLAMEIPPNYGARYTEAFRNSFSQVAEETGARTLPFILDGVATDASLMQEDGIHPTAEAQPLLLQRLLPSLLDVL
ncbi:MAG: arylesterase [Haliea sp.]|uniref:arylesterase n=1 Tax=Haliea sp. TaxID=1932666 RepID=UPI0032EC2778